ncbi:MAG: M23 family metallopeptidase [Epsilonproteobacteria bacterium]|nr:M23 family metallopeptidase [Campylobacterota bacterium]
MKKLLIFLLGVTLTFAYKIETLRWGNGDTFYGFLKRHSLPLSIYYDLKPNLKRKVRFIKNGETVYILKDNNRLKQALIPLDKSTQLQIIYKQGKYYTKVVPIAYETSIHKADAVIKNYLSYDLYQATHLRKLTPEILDIFEDRVNFRALPPNTKIELVYKTKERMGKVKDVTILFASISNKKYTINAFLNPSDGRYYDENGKSLKGMFLAAPLKYKRISSRFGMRFHPILHRWRMHEGIDYVNSVNTPIHSVADGRVIYKGWLGGYGKAVKIKHKNGYITIYAHLNKFPRRLHTGKWVRQGDVIGYLGNTGRSTGPHLHFGVMKNGKWINPARIKKSAKVTLRGRAKNRYLSYIQRFQKEHNIALK